MEYEVFWRDGNGSRAYWWLLAESMEKAAAMAEEKFKDTGFKIDSIRATGEPEVFYKCGSHWINDDGSCVGSSKSNRRRG